MTSLNAQKMIEHEQKLKEQSGRARAMLGMLAKMAVERRASEAAELCDQYIAYVGKSVLDPSVKDRVIEEGRKHAFLAHRGKLDEYLEKAMECAKQGDQMKKISVLKMADNCLLATRRLTGDVEFLNEVQKRIDLVRETSAAGQSLHAKNQVERNNSAKAHKNEKRKYIRYATPPIYVRFGRNETLYKVSDYSLTGLQVEGIPPGLAEGDKVAIAVALDPKLETHNFTGTATVARVLLDKNAVGIAFPNSSDGPIMYFVRERKIDLNLAEISKN